MPTVGVTAHGETWSASSEDITPRSQLIRTHAPNPVGSPLLRLFTSFRESLQVATSPCCQRVLPDSILQIFPQMPGPLPRRSHRVRLPVSSSMSSAFPKTLWVGFPFPSANATFTRVSFSRLQTFRYVQASKFARLPDRSHRCEFPRRAAETFTSGHIVLCYLRTLRICYPSDTGN